MTDVRNRTSLSRRALLYGLAFALILWILIALVVVFWHYLMVALAGVICWRLLAHRLGFRRRPRATWARNVTALSAAFAAWQTRWLNPSKRTVRASVPRSAAPAPTVFDQERDDIPY